MCLGTGKFTLKGEETRGLPIARRHKETCSGKMSRVPIFARTRPWNCNRCGGKSAGTRVGPKTATTLVRSVADRRVCKIRKSTSTRIMPCRTQKQQSGGSSVSSAPNAANRSSFSKTRAKGTRPYNSPAAGRSASFALTPAAPTNRTTPRDKFNVFRYCERHEFHAITPLVV
jgi:hypothetical protein